MYLQPTSPRRMALVARTKLSGLGDHLGAQISDDEIVHNTAERGAELVSLSEFSAGKPIRVIYEIPPDQYQEALSRAAEVLAAQRPYQAIENNCETTGYYVAGLGAQSPQAKSAAFALLIGGIALYLHSNAKQ